MKAMQSKFLILFFLLLMFSLIACEQKFETVTKLSEFIDDEANGYKYFKSVNGVDFILEYKPTDLLVQQELSDNYSDEFVEKLRDKYSKYLYFNLYMSSKKDELLNQAVHDREMFGEMVNMLAFDIDKNIHLYTSKFDTIPIVDFIYPRMYGMTNSTAIMIVYPREKVVSSEEYINFVVEDLGLSTGDIKFKIDLKAINNEPQLKFNF